ncbi:MAG: NifU family protein [Patescibacteria group bacterium]|nr:NifU family protein [Patescibacteria group bacterium]
MEQEVKQAIDQVKPIIQADGGDVVFVGVKDGVVKVKLTGACSHCPMSTYTLKLFLEQKIKEAVKGIKSVEQV